VRRRLRVRRSDGPGYGQDVKLASEFVAGVLVGAGLGWGARPRGRYVAMGSDRSPAARLLRRPVLNVVRASGRMMAEAKGGDREGGGSR